LIVKRATESEKLVWNSISVD